MRWIWRSAYAVQDAVGRHRRAQFADRYDPRVGSRILRGKDMSAADYLDVLPARIRWITKVDASISGFDALIVAPVIAELVASDEAYFRANGLTLRNLTLINFLDVMKERSVEHTLDRYLCMSP